MILAYQSGGDDPTGTIIAVGVLALIVVLVVTKRISGTALIYAIGNSLVALFWGAVGVALLVKGEGAQKLIGVLAVGYSLYGIASKLNWGDVITTPPPKKTAAVRTTPSPSGGRERPKPASTPVAALSDPAARVFEILSLAGPSELETLGEVTGLDVPAARRAVNELARRGLVVIEGTTHTAVLRG